MRKLSKAILEPTETSKNFKILEKKLQKNKLFGKKLQTFFLGKLQNSQVLLKFFVASDFVIK